MLSRYRTRFLGDVAARSPRKFRRYEQIMLQWGAGGLGSVRK